MQIKILELHKLKAVLLLSIVGFLIGCTTSDISTATVPAITNVPVTRVASTVTNMPSATSTRQPSTHTPTLTPTATPEPTRTPFPTRTPTPSPWLIEDLTPFLFYNEGDDLYLIRPNGAKRFITEGWLLEGQPWSPDGFKFIFDPRPYSYPFSASLADLRTGEIQHLFSNIYGDVHWSPDGKYIFSTLENTENVVELTLYDVEQQTSEVLLEILLVGGEKVLTGGWSPDSRQVAFISKQSGQYDLYTISIETQIQKQLTSSPETEVFATWSPSANELVVATSASERSIESQPFLAEKLQIIADTGSEILILGPFDDLTTASWSPNGQQIAYSVDGQVCILNISEASSICPTENTFLDNFASARSFPATWSPDGNWLAFQSIEVDALQCYQLFFLDLSTNTLVDPGSPSCTYSNLHWSRAAP